MDPEVVYPDTIHVITFTHGGAAVIALYRGATIYEKAFVDEKEARKRSAEVACDTFPMPVDAGPDSPILRVL